MVSLPQSAIRLSAPGILSGIVLIVALTLLLGNRFDARFAGGEGKGTQAQAMLQKTLPEHAPLPPVISRGETMTTDAATFATYTLDDTCTVSLAEQTSIILEDARPASSVFTMLTGRVLATGTCTFITRETRVSISGVATLVHVSWRDELLIKPLEGTVLVTQADTQTVLTPEQGAARFFTLPPLHAFEPLEFSLGGNSLVESFYLWSLTK